MIDPMDSKPNHLSADSLRKICPPDHASLERAARDLLRGDLIGLPTETVYGLAARGDDAVAVARIFAAKNRPANNPLILHVSCPDDASVWLDP